MSTTPQYEKRRDAAEFHIVEANYELGVAQTKRENNVAAFAKVGLNRLRPIHEAEYRRVAI